MENQQAVLTRKVYSKGQILLSAIIGGPLVAGYLISQNYKTFGETEVSKKSLLVTVVSTIVFLIMITALPESMTRNIPNLTFALIPVGVISWFVQTHQAKHIDEYLQKGYRKSAILPVLGKSVLSLLIVIILVAILAFIQILISPGPSY